MRFYMIDDGHKQRVEGTLTQAHKVARDGFEVDNEDGDKVKLIFTRFDVTISEVEVPTDKESLVNLINYGITDATVNLKTIRSWCLSDRGGLRSNEGAA